MRFDLLIDLDSKIPIFSLLKLSSYNNLIGKKSILGNFNQSFDINNPKRSPMFLNIPEEYLYAADTVYCTVIFTKNRYKAEYLQQLRPDIIIGGIGWDFDNKLPDAVEAMKPDYNLYSEEHIYSRICNRVAKKENIIKKARFLRDSGLGFTTRGCINVCGYCCVPRSEGRLRKVASITDLLNPRSNHVILMDNNVTALSYDMFHDLISQLIEQKISVNFTQGIDLRQLDPNKALLLKQLKLSSGIHYAWDEMGIENLVLQGISCLSKFIKPKYHRCYMLVNYNTTFAEDFYRFKKLSSDLGVDPFVMPYAPITESDRVKWEMRYPLANDPVHKRIIFHFARYVNGYFFKSPLINSFLDYEPLRKEKLHEVREVREALSF